MNEDNVIDVEAEEIEESDNLPAVVESETHGAAPPIEGRDWSSYSRPERRCTAKSSRTGEQCKNVAILGHHVCRYHGGAAPQIKQAARTRLENAADLMAKQLLGIALAGDTDTVKLAAIRDALDRAGLRAPSEVVVSAGEPKPYETVFDSIYSGPPGEAPSNASGYESAGRTRDVADVEIFAPTQPHPDTQAQPYGQAEPRDQGMADISAAEYVDASSEDEPPRQGRPHRRDRDRPPQPPSRHITGEAAIRAANWANAAMAESHGLPWGESARRQR